MYLAESSGWPSDCRAFCGNRTRTITEANEVCTVRYRGKPPDACNMCARRRSGAERCFLLTPA